MSYTKFSQRITTRKVNDAFFLCWLVSKQPPNKGSAKLTINSNKNITTLNLVLVIAVDWTTMLCWQRTNTWNINSWHYSLWCSWLFNPLVAKWQTFLIRQLPSVVFIIINVVYARDVFAKKFGRGGGLLP